MLTLFAALCKNLTRVLSPPAAAQFALCSVSSFRIIESANTVGTFVVYIPVTNTVVKRITTISVRL